MVFALRASTRQSDDSRPAQTISRRELSQQIKTAVNAFAAERASPDVQRQVARLSPTRALEWFNRSHSIASAEQARQGPLTVSGASVRALRRYFPGFGVVGAQAPAPARATRATTRSSNVDGRDTSPRSPRSERAAPTALQQPRQNGVRYGGANQPQQAANDSPNFLERLFGAGRASGNAGGTGEAAARAELMRQTGGRLRPNHAYVVQLDRNNSGHDVARLKGQTYVFSMDLGGNIVCRGSFNSSSQPTTNAPGSGRDAPYILDGMYSMSTAITGETRGFAINAYSAYRDTNQNGMIDATERRRVGTGAIMFHTAALGSAGCQIVDASEWMSFAQTVQRYGASGASYVLRRN